jgi:hypothetical protein
MLLCDPLHLFPRIRYRASFLGEPWRLLADGRFKDEFRSPIAVVFQQPEKAKVKFMSKKHNQ